MLIIDDLLCLLCVSLLSILSDLRLYRMTVIWKSVWFECDFSVGFWNNVFYRAGPLGLQNWRECSFLREGAEFANRTVFWVPVFCGDEFDAVIVPLIAMMTARNGVSLALEWATRLPDENKFYSWTTLSNGDFHGIGPLIPPGFQKSASPSVLYVFWLCFLCLIDMRLLNLFALLRQVTFSNH